MGKGPSRNDFASIRPHPREDRRAEPQVRELLRALRSRRRSADRSRRSGHAGRAVRALFAELRRELVPLVKASPRAAGRRQCLRRKFSEDKQLAFGRKLAEKFGYDFSRGRQDKTHHPFMTEFRAATCASPRAYARTISSRRFSARCTRPVTRSTSRTSILRRKRRPVGQGASAGVHESQSRLWENIVGRSRGFWTAFLRRSPELFPAQLGDVSLDAFYRAINKVERSLIRTNADEVTYCLHVIMRFDFELALLEGTARGERPARAWRERFRADLGIVPETDPTACCRTCTGTTASWAARSNVMRWAI